ncbi:MAG: 50S ribosomal protein L10, partial [Pseudomonadota bacterium]
GMIVLDYTGLNVEKVTILRKQIKVAGSEMKVTKNTLLKIATRDTKFEALHTSLEGQTAVTFIDGDPAQLAKILTKFVKDNPDMRFKIRAGVLEKTFLTPDTIEQLGNLPGREVLLGQFVGMLAAPLVGFVSVLSDIPRKFMRVLTAINEKKEKAVN